MKNSVRTEKILKILFDIKVKPSKFIEIYRKYNGNINKTIGYFTWYKDPKFEYGEAKNDSGSYKYISSREIIDFTKKNKIGLLDISNDNYPDMLKNIYLPPPMLFFKGSRIKNSGFNIAVVGCRKCTAYGKEAAMYISRSLSEMGITVVSGLAAGIDGQAHRAALEGKGGSIGVLGCGIDVAYPPENKFLYEKILKNGSIVTEFAPGTPPLKSNFPVRNRIISGLCRGVVVIEAGERSGAIITCEMALKQNREVLAVPGNIFSPASRGCHRLINEGAKLVHDIDDILDEFSGYPGKIFKTGKTGSSGNKKESRKSGIELNGDELKIYEYIGYKSKSLEEIVSYSGKEVKNVLRILAFLEMKRLIKEDNFNKYSRLF